MKDLQLTILKNEDLERRYKQLRDTQMAILTDKAVADGYSIAILYYPGLKYDYAGEWFRYADRAVAARFKGHKYKIGAFTDLSQVKNDQLYFAFKTKWERVQIAHSLGGTDSEGFTYNA